MFKHLKLSFKTTNLSNYNVKTHSLMKISGNNKTSLKVIPLIQKTNDMINVVNHNWFVLITELSSSNEITSDGCRIYFNSYQNHIACLPKETLINILTYPHERVVDILQVPKIYDHVNDNFSSFDWFNAYKKNEHIYQYIPRNYFL